MTSATITSPVRPVDAQSPGATFPAIPFSRLLRVEWGKATDTRAARWLLALVAASTVGLMLAPLLAPSRIDQTYTSYLRFAAVGLSILLPIVSILTLTSEWSQRTVLTTFTQEPRRIRVINAKVTVSLLLAGGAAVFGGLVTAAGLGVAAATGRELDANLNAGVLVGYLLFVLLNVLTGGGLRGAVAQLGGCHRPVLRAPHRVRAARPRVDLAGRVDRLVGHLQLAAAGRVVRAHAADPGVGGRLGSDSPGRRDVPDSTARDQLGLKQARIRAEGCGLRRKRADDLSLRFHAASCRLRRVAAAWTLSALM